MIVYFYPRVALRAFLILYFITGFMVWLFARANVFHIGLSYVVYGLVSFVFWTGVFRRSIRSIVLALIVTTLYSGMISGVLPTTEILQRNISWESHLLGAIMGVFVAYFYKEEVEEDEVDPSVSEEEKSFFFDQNVFEKTKAERQREAEEEQIRQQFPPTGDWFSYSTFWKKLPFVGVRLVGGEDGGRAVQTRLYKIRKWGLILFFLIHNRVDKRLILK